MELVKAAPKSQQLADLLRQKIISGAIAPGCRLMTTRELAEKFSVSKQVVQSAFAVLEKERMITTHVGRGTYVAPQNAPVKSVGVIIPGLSDEHNVLPLVLQAHLQKLKYHVNIYDMDTIASHRDILKHYISHINPDVMIIDNYYNSPVDLYTGFPDSIKKIFVNRFEHEQRLDDSSYILLDYYKMGYLCAKHLISIGCKRIALIAFSRTSGCTCDQFSSGCEDAISESGGERPLFINFSLFTLSDYRSLLESSDLPDGVIGMDAFRLIPLMEVLKEDKMKRKRSIPIISGSNTPWAEAYDLTSLNRHYEKIPFEVEKAINTQKNMNIKIAPDLIFRKSCPA